MAANLSDIITSPEFKNSKYKIPVILGIDENGNSVIRDLAQMSPMLVNEGNGIGKDSLADSILMSITTRLKPDQCKIILAASDEFRFKTWAEIPHLMRPIAETIKGAADIIKFLSAETDRRKKTRQKDAPYIVAIINDFAEVLYSDKTMEAEVQNIAQNANAARIYFVAIGYMAIKKRLQPMPDNLYTAEEKWGWIREVWMKPIPNLIKANFATRITFRTHNKSESVKFMGHAGAEQLSQHGDMLFCENGRLPTRIKTPKAAF